MIIATKEDRKLTKRLRPTAAPRDRTSCSLGNILFKKWGFSYGLSTDFLFFLQNAEADAKRAADLLALDRAKTSFFSNTSHELRTPLTLVLGPLEDLLARSDELPAEVKTRLDMVARNANR